MYDFLEKKIGSCEREAMDNYTTLGAGGWAQLRSSLPPHIWGVLLLAT